MTKRTTKRTTKKTAPWRAICTVAALLGVGGISPAQAQTTQEIPGNASPAFVSPVAPLPRAGGYLLDGSPRRRPYQFMISYGFYCDAFCWSNSTTNFGAVGNLGVRWHTPVLHNGFLPHTNDWFSIEWGANVQFWHHSNLTGMNTMAVTAASSLETFWGFRFAPLVAAYVKLGVGVKGSSWRYGRPAERFHCTVTPTSHVGFMFFKYFSLRLETGYPYILSLTTGFDIFYRDRRRPSS